MKLFCWVGIHLWKRIHDDGAIYRQCRCCRKRDIKSYSSGYTDWHWIKGGHEMPMIKK